MNRLSKRWLDVRDFQIKDIMTTTNKTSAAVVLLIETLIAMNIVAKTIFFGKDIHKTKKTKYYVKDPFWNFYYYFMKKNESDYIILNERDFYDKHIEPHLNTFVGFIFEKICQQFLIRKYQLNEKQSKYQISSYWKNDTKNNLNYDIDIIFKKNNQQLYFFECKWTTKPLDQKIIDTLEMRKDDFFVEQHKNFSNYNCKLGFFSKAGYVDNINLQDYECFDLHHLYDQNLLQTPKINTYDIKNLRELLTNHQPITISSQYFSQSLTFYWRELQPKKGIDADKIDYTFHSKIECDVLQQQDGNFFVRFGKKFGYYFQNAIPVVQEQTAFVEKFIAIYQHYASDYKNSLKSKAPKISWNTVDKEYAFSLIKKSEIYYADFFNHFFWLFKNTSFQEIVCKFGEIQLLIHYPDSSSTPFNLYYLFNFKL